MRIKGRFLKKSALVVACTFVLTAGGVFAVSAVQEFAGSPASPGHHDFLAFYAASRLVVSGAPSRLYDASAVTLIQRQVIATPVGAAGYMPYLNPPVAAAVQAPLGLLSEWAARLVWAVPMVLIGLFCCWFALQEMHGRSRWLGSILLASTFPVYQAVVEGQWSFVMLAAVLIALAAARRQWYVMCGIALGILILKPPLLMAAGVAFIVVRQWKILAAMLAGAISLVIIALPVTGINSDILYASFSLSVLSSHFTGAGTAGATAWSGTMQGMAGINGMATAYFGQQHAVAVDVVTLLGTLAVVILWIKQARAYNSQSNPRTWALLVLSDIFVVLLTDLHLYAQDCVLLIAALPLVLQQTRSERHLAIVLVFAFILDSAWLDQLSVAPHVFTWCLISLMAWISVLFWRSKVVHLLGHAQSDSLELTPEPTSTRELSDIRNVRTGRIF